MQHIHTTTHSSLAFAHTRRPALVKTARCRTRFPTTHGALQQRNTSSNIHPSRPCSSALTWTPQRGFLPATDPLRRLEDPDFAAWEDCVADLSGLLANAYRGNLQRRIASLPPFPLHALKLPSPTTPVPHETPELWRAMLLLSYIAHAYVWGDPSYTPSTLPAKVARPWVAVAAALDVPPVLNYACYVLLNWRRIDPEGPIALGNITSLANFTGGTDEEWFRMVHVAIEAQAAAALQGVVDAKAAGVQHNLQGIRDALTTTGTALDAMRTILARMPEKCDPLIYYKRVRLPASGWRNNPTLPQGLVYQGVSKTPMELYGATGAQSSVLPALDCALGVEHPAKGTPAHLSAYLKVMRGHMPRDHRAVLNELTEGPCLRDIVDRNRGALLQEYDACVAELVKFRAQHVAMARTYIHQFNEKATGTGGSNVLPALQGYKISTAKHKMGTTVGAQQQQQQQDSVPVTTE